MPPRPAGQHATDMGYVWVGREGEERMLEVRKSVSK